MGRPSLTFCDHFKAWLLATASTSIGTTIALLGMLSLWSESHSSRSSDLMGGLVITFILLIIFASLFGIIAVFSYISFRITQGFFYVPNVIIGIVTFGLPLTALNLKHVEAFGFGLASTPFLALFALPGAIGATIATWRQRKRLSQVSQFWTQQSHKNV